MLHSFSLEISDEVTVTPSRRDSIATPFFVSPRDYLDTPESSSHFILILNVFTTCPSAAASSQAQILPDKEIGGFMDRKGRQGCYCIHNRPNTLSWL